MRRWTFITLVVLFLVIVAAAAFQIALASRDQGPFPGPVSGTPLPPIETAP